MDIFEVKKIITEGIFKAVIKLGVPQAEKIVLEAPTTFGFGDYSCNVAMKLAKSLKKNPLTIAEKIKSACEKNESVNQIVDQISIAPPGFINFWLKKQTLLDLCQSLYQFKKTGKKIMVEYSSPNPNKPLHLGHARNQALGMAMGNILKYLGNEVIFANWINNRGVAICKAMWGYIKKPKISWQESLTDWLKNSADWPQPQVKPDHFVMDFYVLAEKAEKADEKVKLEFLAMLAEWEKGNPGVKKLWQTIVNWVYQGWKETYSKQHCLFDHWYFESDFYELGKKLISEKKEAGIFYQDENGAVKANLSKYGLPDKVLIRSDGTSIYITPDLALAKRKFDDYDLEKSIYVVGCDQELYFKQLFAILDLLGVAGVDKCQHLAFGMVNLTSGKMSTREGTVVLLDDLIADLSQKLQEKNPDQEISEKLAICAIDYMLLKNNLRQEIAFDPVKSIDTEGNTGIYLQYSLVRAKSVLKKIGDRKIFVGEINPNAEESALLRTLFKFPEVVMTAGDNLAPNLICNFLFDLCQKFNNFYAKHRIIEGEEINPLRVLLAERTEEVLRIGMELLNLPVIEKM